MNKNRIKCKYPMSQFYLYEDQIPEGTRISTISDCRVCKNKECEASHCLISTNQKKFFNHCPECDATDDDIKWLDKEAAEDSVWQNATCLKCGCDFSEIYTYFCTEKGHNK